MVKTFEREKRRFQITVKVLILLITDCSLRIFLLFVGYLCLEDEAVSGIFFSSLAVVGDMYRSDMHRIMR